MLISYCTSVDPTDTPTPIVDARLACFATQCHYTVTFAYPQKPAGHPGITQSLVARYMLAMNNVTGKASSGDISPQTWLSEIGSELRRTSDLLGYNIDNIKRNVLYYLLLQYNLSL